MFEGLHVSCMLLSMGLLSFSRFVVIHIATRGEALTMKSARKRSLLRCNAEMEVEAGVLLTR